MRERENKRKREIYMNILFSNHYIKYIIDKNNINIILNYYNNRYYIDIMKNNISLYSSSVDNYNDISSEIESMIDFLIEMKDI